LTRNIVTGVFALRSEFRNKSCRLLGLSAMALPF
jgi:hypothetical protein